MAARSASAVKRGIAESDAIHVAVVERRCRLDERLRQRVEAETGPLGAHRLGRGRDEGAFEPEDRDQSARWAPSPPPVRWPTGRRRRGSCRAATTARRRTRAAPRPASTTGASALTVNSSFSAWLTSRERMSTSGTTISVTPPRSLWVSNSGSSSAPGRFGPSAQAPASTTAPAQAMAGDRRHQRVQRPARARCAGDARGAGAAGRGHRSRRRSTARLRDDPPLVDAEGGDEHEQHGAGNERLAARLGAEGERVGEPHGRRHRGTGEERPAAGVLHRRRRRLELVADDAEVGAHGLPRVGEREDAGERVRVVDPRDQPGEHDEHERDGDERREAQPAGQVGRRRDRRRR